MCKSQSSIKSGNSKVDRGRGNRFLFWHGGGNGYLGGTNYTCATRDESHTKAPLCLPFKGQADKWATSARELYYNILAQADTVTYTSEDYQDGCMLERNRYLVDHAAYLLAIYNGEWRGGTAATVRYARKLGREIIVIDPHTC